SYNCWEFINLKFPVVASLKPTVEFKLITVLPGLPVFVVIIITPFDAREPYNPVAAASLRIVTVSISLGFAVPPIIPSTTYNGEGLAVIDPDPLITTLAEAVGSPEELETTTPGALP